MTITAVGTQEGGTTGDNSATVTRAFGSNVAVGNLIVVGAVKSNTTAFTAGNCTKSAGTATIGAVSLDVSLSFDFGSSPTSVGIWSALVTGAGSCTMQVAGAAGTFWDIGTGEYNSDVGWDSSRLETSNNSSNSTDNLTAFTTGNGTSAGAALFFAQSGSNASATVTFTPDAAFTQVHEQEDASAHQIGSTIRRIVAAGTTDAGDWAIANNNLGYDAVLAVYKEVAAGGSTRPVKMAGEWNGYAGRSGGFAG